MYRIFEYNQLIVHSFNRELINQNVDHVIVNDKLFSTVSFAFSFRFIIILQSILIKDT